MVVALRFAAGGEGALHSHPHVQATYRRLGPLPFTVGGASFEVGPATAFVVPRDASTAAAASPPAS
jgi:quercetin dioxygenase-like cupin family protein